MPMPEQQQIDQQRIRYGLWIILTGFALVALITVVSIFKWNDVTSVATAIGATTSLVGTVVGSFLGYRSDLQEKRGWRLTVSGWRIRYGQPCPCYHLRSL